MGLHNTTSKLSFHSQQGRVTANGRVGATAAVYTAAILGESNARGGVGIE
jgi:hypothetical protein